MKTKYSKLLCLLVVAITQTACDMGPKYWPSFKGSVMHYQTNEPIKDVYIIREWQGGAGLVDYQSVCYHLESTISNKNGEFTIPSYFEWVDAFWLDNKYVTYYLYKPGYEEYIDPDNPYRNDADTLWLMKPFSGTTNERFKYFQRLISSLTCANAGDSYRNAYPLYEAVFYEAKSLAETGEQKRIVDWLREVAAWAAVESNSSNDDIDIEQRIEQFLRENLQ